MLFISSLGIMPIFPSVSLQKQKMIVFRRTLSSKSSFSTLHDRKRPFTLWTLDVDWYQTTGVELQVLGGTSPSKQGAVDGLRRMIWSSSWKWWRYGDYMDLDGWDVCEEGIFNEKKNAGPHEMTTGMLSCRSSGGPRHRRKVQGMVWDEWFGRHHGSHGGVATPWSWMVGVSVRKTYFMKRKMPDHTRWPYKK